MTKDDISQYIIKCFSENVNCEQFKAELYDSGPEYGVYFSCQKINRKVKIMIILTENQQNIFLGIIKIRNSFIRINDNSKYESFNKYFINNKPYKKVPKIITEENYLDVINKNIAFMFRELEDVLCGRFW